MANVRKENIWLIDWIELFINHWRFGHNYKNSTILTDPQYNIIAFFDNGTENIDRIENDLPFKGWFIIADGKGIDIEGTIEYKPYDFEMARYKWKTEVKKNWLKGWEAIDLWNKIKKDYILYNKNYFTNLKLWN